MSKSLVLLIPEDDMNKELVEEYYIRIISEINKHSEGDISLNEHSEYNRKVRQIEEGSVPTLQEGVVDGPLEEIGRNRFDRIFKLEDGDFRRPILEEEGIRELKSMFRDAVEELSGSQSETNWEATLAGHIVMCEFALDYGYEIELSY